MRSAVVSSAGTFSVVNSAFVSTTSVFSSTATGTPSILFTDGTDLACESGKILWGKKTQSGYPVFQKGDSLKQGY